MQPRALQTARIVSANFSSVISQPLPLTTRHIGSVVHNSRSAAIAAQREGSQKTGKFLLTNPASTAHTMALQRIRKVTVVR